MRRSDSFRMVLSEEKKEMLDKLAKLERLSKSNVMRRLLWQEATKKSLVVKRQFSDK